MIHMQVSQCCPFIVRGKRMHGSIRSHELLADIAHHEECSAVMQVLHHRMLAGHPNVSTQTGRLDMVLMT